MPIFSKEEMQRRLRSLKAGLDHDHVDVALIHTPDHVYYFSGVALLSGWGRPMWAMVSSEAGAVCGAAIHEENIRQHSFFDQVLLYGDDEEPLRKSLELCISFVTALGAGSSRIGIEEGLMPYGIRKALEERLPDATFVDISPWLEEMRLVKSDEEVALLELGADLAKIGADAFLEALNDNITELAVAGHAVNAVNRAMGALSRDGLTGSAVYAQFGGNTMIPHLHPTSNRLKRGDVVTLNIFPAVWGYSAELIRTFVYGEPTVESLSILAATEEALLAGKDSMRPGAVMGDINRRMDGILNAHRLAAYVRCGNGHVNGIMIGAAGREERGELRPYNRRRLLPGMVNTVEPSVYVPDIGGFRQSDMMVVTSTTARCLTDFPLRIGW